MFMPGILCVDSIGSFGGLLSFVYWRLLTPLPNLCIVLICSFYGMSRRIWSFSHLHRTLPSYASCATIYDFRFDIGKWCFTGAPETGYWVYPIQTCRFSQCKLAFLGPICATRARIRVWGWKILLVIKIRCLVQLRGMHVVQICSMESLNTGAWCNYATPAEPKSDSKL